MPADQANQLAPGVLPLPDHRCQLRRINQLARRVESGHLTLHGWHYVIEEGEVHVLDVERGAFVPAGGPGPDAPDDPARDVSRLQ